MKLLSLLQAAALLILVIVGTFTGTEGSAVLALP